MVSSLEMIVIRLVELSRQLLLYKGHSNTKTMHNNRDKSRTMHSDIIVFRYAQIDGLP
jgi:hypothetical protein